MKKLYFVFLIFLLGIVITPNVYAQYLPVVFNNTYGDDIVISKTCLIEENGQVVIVGKKKSDAICIWLDREGNVLLSKTFKNNYFASVNDIQPLKNGSILLIGNNDSSKSSKGSGRAIVLHSDGAVEKDFYLGNAKTNLMAGKQLKTGDFIFSGAKLNMSGSSEGYLCKISETGAPVFEFTSDSGSECNWFDVNEGNSSILAVLNGTSSTGSSIIKLDKNGSPVFMTPIVDKTFKIEKCIAMLNGYSLIVGQGDQMGGCIMKVRPEGDIVFTKQVLAPSPGTKLNMLLSLNKGNILVAGSNDKSGFFQVLRQDGTELSKSIYDGHIAGVASGLNSGDVVVAVYDPSKRRGDVIKLNSDGRKLYEKSVASNYSQLKINATGDILLGCPEEGRLSMLSSYGELIFDRFIDDASPKVYSNILMTNCGEIIFNDSRNRVAKLAHGIYIDDVTVSKPINGYATAVFTVTLSGYAFSDEGAPIPVSINYKTREQSATANNNFTPVNGTLSFVPNNESNEKYLSKQVIEVPVKANDLLEGQRTFAIELDQVKYSYIIKNKGVGTIEDQQGIVKMIGSVDGIEGEKDVEYKLGLFKTNGTPLMNATGTDIIVEGRYDEGTADELDFDMSKMPRLQIAPNAHAGTMYIPTLEDTRFESMKTIIVNFDKIHAMSDTQISFPSTNLICEGKLHDQAANISIASLGNQSRLNNTVTNFFKITLHRAKDGVLQTNNSGSDIVITAEVDTLSSAKMGTDFALVNAHDLKILGDGKRSAVNLNGLVLFNPNQQQDNLDKNLIVKLKSVIPILGAAPLSISKDSKSNLTIKGN
ncbi:MAG: Calx-beta domain-containing protein [Bacteroidales bacterium]